MSNAKFHGNEVFSRLLTGMPGALFTRDLEHLKMYWASWLETTLTRDLPLLFKRNYDPDVALAILNRMLEMLREGELPSLNHFHQPARILRNYLDALSQIFVVDRISCHPAGFGKEVWLFGDGGLASYLMGKTDGLSAQKSLVRQFLNNEWRVHQTLENELNVHTYYKSAQGSPVDAIFQNVPILISSDASEISSRLSWVERPIRGAMKKLGAKTGIITGPVDKIIAAKDNDGVSVVPWSALC
jgi:predicted AAA+ superfamily ATPase